VRRVSAASWRQHRDIINIGARVTPWLHQARRRRGKSRSVASNIINIMRRRDAHDMRRRVRIVGVAS